MVPALVGTVLPMLDTSEGVNIITRIVNMMNLVVLSYIRSYLLHVNRL